MPDDTVVEKSPKVVHHVSFPLAKRPEKRQYFLIYEQPTPFVLT